MSVTFNRAQLIKVAEQALAKHQKAAQLRAVDITKYRRAHATEHGPASRERALRLRDGLTKALKRIGPVTRKDVRALLGDHYRIDDLFYSEPSDYDVRNHVDRPDGLLTPAEATETGALLQVLKAATGDTVTANELKLLGLKNLQPIFTAAAHEATK